jgi:hypothetical protein
MVKTAGLPARILLDAPVACDRHAGDARKQASRRGYRSSEIELHTLPADGLMPDRRSA